MFLKQLGRMAKYKVYVTRLIPDPGSEHLEANNCELTFWESADAIPHEDLVNNLKENQYDALLCMLTDKIDTEVLDAAGPQLQVVSSMSVGFEHIDLEECKSRGIIVTNTPNVSTDSVAELTVALLLLTTRRIKEGIKAVRTGKWTEWRPNFLLGNEITNKVVGIYGLGRIGYNVARRLLPFGPKKLLYHDVVQVAFASDVGAEYKAELNDMLTEVDLLCICCNLTPQTKHRFNKSAFTMMKKTAFIINTGRGGVIQHDDLYEALKNGKIAGAGLDVTEPEPLPKSHPLTSLDNCVILPHMGSNTWDARNNMSLTAAKNIISVLNKQKPIGYVSEQDNYVSEQDNYVSEQDNHVSEQDNNESEQDNHVSEKDNIVSEQDNYVSEQDTEQDNYVSEQDTEQDNYVSEQDTEQDNQVSEQDNQVSEQDNHVSEQDNYVSEQDKHASEQDNLIHSAIPEGSYSL